MQTSKDGLDIATGPGILRIKQLQLPGKKPCPLRMYSMRVRISSYPAIFCLNCLLSGIYESSGNRSQGYVSGSRTGIFPVCRVACSSTKLVPAKDRALLQEICYGTLRWLNRFRVYRGTIDRTPAEGQAPFSTLFIAGWSVSAILYPSSPHAALAETVNATKIMNGDSFRGMINGVLRNAQRRQEELLQTADKTKQPALVILAGY